MLRKLAAAAVTASLATAVAVVPAQAGSTKTVSVKNNSFSPGSVSIEKGGKVTWKWTQGGVPHNVTPAKRREGLHDVVQEGLHVHEDVLEGRHLQVRLHHPLLDEGDRQGQLSGCELVAARSTILVSDAAAPWRRIARTVWSRSSAPWHATRTW